MRVLMMGLAVALMGCQQDVASIRPATSQMTVAAASAVPADCPPANTVIRTSIGSEFTYLGRDPSDAEFCVWRARDRLGRDLHNLRPVPAGTEAFHRAGVRQMLPLSVGRVAQYQSRSSDGAWNHTIRVVSADTVTVPAGRFDVWVVERIEEGTFNNGYRGEQVFYFERGTGVLVKQVSRLVRGTGSPGSTWEAVSITRG
ncbi:hypothetical protein HB662_10205 [Roseomonas frigidaquae]|uniref:Lipoprotein n=1 Tax=Falsiroseomonas frigidaquae TaxID=487318 RepID=A0ABX1EYI3_9PROT|nr:hypothetical protein [Falsiroseomonas frigidaquae]NKE45152.1 hypothetical protein [Falsiroseomonas frigidaquae]